MFLHTLFPQFLSDLGKIQYEIRKLCCWAFVNFMNTVNRKGHTFLTSIHKTAFMYASTLQPYHSSITPYLAEVCQDFISTIMALLVIISVKVKVKCTLVQARRLCTGRTAHRGSRGIALLFHDHGTRRGWGVSVTPWPLFTPGKTWYPMYRRLGGHQGQSGQVRKISPPPGFDPRTI